MNRSSIYGKIRLPKRLEGYIDVVYDEQDWFILESADNRGCIPDEAFSKEQLARAYKRGVIDKELDDTGTVHYKVAMFRRRIACMIEAPEYESWCSLPEPASTELHAYLTDPEVWWEGKLKLIRQGKWIQKEVLPKEQIIERLKNIGDDYCFTIHQCDCNAYKQGCRPPKKTTCINWQKKPVSINTLADRGITECKTVEDAIATIEWTDRDDFVHVFSGNSICNCCTCCCINLSNKDNYPSKKIHQLYYVAHVDEDVCADCGQCVSRCRFHALQSEGGHMTVDPDKCWGCGICRVACPTGALQVVPLENPIIYDQKKLLESETPT